MPSPTTPHPPRRRVRPRMTTGLIVAGLLAPAGAARTGPDPAVAANDGPAQACAVAVVRQLTGGGAGGPLWGDEVTVGVEARLDCPAGRVTELAITETLPPEIAVVAGIGRAPDAVDGRAVTWRFAAPAVAPAVIRFSYRIYATPDASGFGPDGTQAVAWPMLAALTEAGAERRTAPSGLPPLVVRERPAGLGCGLSRARTFAPDPVLAGAPFDVRLRLTVNTCAAHRLRTHGVIALQPAGDAAEALQLAQVNTALLDPARVAPENALFGLVLNVRGGPKVQMPTTERVFLEDLARGQPPVADGGADAAAALGAALDLLPDWPAHHEVVLYVTHGRAPRADPAAVAALRDTAARRGVEIAAVCVGGGCDPALAYAHAAPDLRTLRADVQDGLMDAHRGPPVVVEALEIDERQLRYVQVDPASVSPAGGVPVGDAWRWRFDGPAVGRTVEVGYRARIDIWGRLPLGAGGRARLRYVGGGQTTFDLPKSLITVERDPDAVPPPCRAAVAKSAAPARVPLGDPVTVTLDFGAECPGESRLADVALVLDVSGSMAGQKLADAREAALTFLDVLQPGHAQVGLVTFDDQVVAREALTTDFDRLRRVLGQMAAGGGTDIAAGLRAAADVLAARRAGATPVIIAMTDGFNGGGPDPVVAAALEARALGLLVATICFGDACDPSLPEVASAPAYHFAAPDADSLRLLFAGLALMLRESRLATARVVDVLPPHMRLVPGSAVPPPSRVDPPAGGRGETLTWDVDDPPLGTLRLRYEAEPLVLGPQPTNAEARVRFVDDRGRPGEAVFPVPVVEAYVPDPTGPCVPALGKTASPTEAAIGEPVAVALTVGLDCPRRAAPMDIVLVVDHSASMGALDRLANAQRAAGAFADAVDPAATRLGLVAFADDVTARVPLTADFARVRAAVGGLRAAGRTGIAQALNAAGDLLAERRPEALGAVVLLTDGADSAGAGPMLAAAERLRAGGTTVVTVCAGECDAALPRVASRPALAFDVPDSAQLVAVFQSLATQLTRDRVTDLVITDAFPAAVDVDAASFAPSPSDWDGDTAVWKLDTLTDAGLAIGYRVTPRVAGRVPANRYARLDYVFGPGLRGRAFFPVPVIAVRGPATPTATATGAASPTATATPGSATATPTATPTRIAGHTAYLPRVGRE